MQQGLDRLKGKVAIVTGSTSGIGKACAVLFAKEGAKVVLNGRRLEKGNQAVEEITKAGGEAIFIQADMSVDADITNLVDQTVKQFGRIDILLNNAGTDNLKPFADLTDEDWDMLVRLDGRAYFKTMQEVIPIMVEQGKGSIINITSLASLKPRPDSSVYGFVKAGVNEMTRVVAQEYAAKGIRANNILPGLVKTELLKDDDPNLPNVLAECPTGRMAEPVEIANVALFLASDEASYVTGTLLNADGGSYH